MQENYSEVIRQLRLIEEDILKHHNNSRIYYFEIHGLRNKIKDPRVIMKTLSLDNLVLSESRINKSVLSAWFNVEGYEDIVGSVWFYYRLWNQKLVSKLDKFWDTFNPKKIIKLEI